jgi:hypothetical protein
MLQRSLLHAGHPRVRLHRRDAPSRALLDGPRGAQLADL